MTIDVSALYLLLNSTPFLSMYQCCVRCAVRSNLPPLSCEHQPHSSHFWVVPICFLFIFILLLNALLYSARTYMHTTCIARLLHNVWRDWPLFKARSD